MEEAVETAGSLERLVYDEARRGIDLQLQSVDALRTRAGTLLAAAALVTTFFGGQALEGPGGLSGWALVAVIAFIALAALTVAVLSPRTFSLILDPSELINDYVDETPQVSQAVMLRDLALHHDESRTSNDGTVKWLVRLFRVATALLGVEVVAWLIAI